MVVYVDRDRLQFYGGAFEKIENLVFADNFVKDLEVIDKNALIGAISSFVNVNHAEANLVLIFSDTVSFLMEIPANLSKEQFDTKEKTFYGSVPFAEIATKLIKTQSGYVAVAVNWELIKVVREALGIKGFKLVATIPSFVVDGFDRQLGLTDKIFSVVFSKIDIIKNYDFSDQETFNLAKATATANKPVMRSLKLKPVHILLVIFVMLIVVFVGLVFIRR